MHEQFIDDFEGKSPTSRPGLSSPGDGKGHPDRPPCVRHFLMAIPEFALVRHLVDHSITAGFKLDALEVRSSPVTDVVEKSL